MPDGVLDELDRKILAHYQRDTRISVEKLGAEVGLSAAAVHRRLKRLRDDGVIEAEIAVIAPAAVGLPLTCIVEIDLDREGTSELDGFAERMRGCPAVQQCFYVTGQFDFIAIVVVADMAAYDAFTRAYLLADANVKSFTTHVAFSRIKTGLALAIQAG